jgi:hypothetical protein
LLLYENSPMANCCPNYQDVPSHKSLAYLPKFDLLSQFDHPSIGDRLNYTLSLERCMQLLPKVSDKLGSSIRDDNF